MKPLASGNCSRPLGVGSRRSGDEGEITLGEDVRVGRGERARAERVFVGRGAELAELDDRLEEVRAGRPQIVVVDGPPGVGKSALVRNFLASNPDIAVVSASGDEWESRLPYGVLAQLLADVDVPEPLRGLGAPDAPVPDPLAVGAQLVSVVSDLAADQPLAVVVDGLQWADLASVRALTFAFRRLRNDSVLGLLIARDGLPAVAEGLGRLSAENGTRLQLEGLDAGQLRELASAVTGSGLSRRAAYRLWEHTEGNPLQARALLDELTPDMIDAADGPLPAPRSFSMLTVARLAACAEPARRLVEAVAVAGSRCSVPVAARLAALDDPGPALEQAVEKQLLVVTPSSPGTVRFLEPLARAAIYHHLGPARRAALHHAAATLADFPASVDHRIAAALGQDPLLAAEVETHARREAARGALSAASAYFVAAARLTPSRAERERLTLDAVDGLLDAGDVSGATRIARGIEQFTDSPRARHVCGRLALFQGRGGDAEQLLLEAWQRCDPRTDGTLCARISADMAQLCATQLRPGDAAEWARRAIDASDDAELTAAALGVLVPCLGMVGRPSEGLNVASSVLKGHAEQEPVDVEGLLGRGVVRLWIDDLAESRTDLLAVLDACRGRPASRPALIAMGTLADVEYRAGAWDDSLRHAVRAVSLMEDSDQRWMAAFLYSGATWVLAPRGDWTGAESHAEAAVAAARQVGDPLSVFCAAAGRAHVAFFRGDHQLVVTMLEPLFDRENVAVPEEPGVHAWRHLHAESLLHLGRTSDASAAADVLERLSRSPERRSTRAYATRVRAMVARAEGDQQAARAGFEAAIHQFDELGMPFEVALSREDYGGLLRRAGERTLAASQLQLARETYRRLAAEPLLARVETELAACGLAPRRSRHRRTALTPQEIAVATLVGAGRTNRETAAELVISVKTVEHHLRAIYAKLGVRSRAELAATLADAAG